MGKLFERLVKFNTFFRRSAHKSDLWMAVNVDWVAVLLSELSEKLQLGLLLPQFVISESMRRTSF